MGGGRWSIFHLASAAGVLAVLELLALAFTHLYLRPEGLVYDPAPLLAKSDEAAYREQLADRDPLLGWPAPRWFGDPSLGRRLDASGARLSPAFPRPGNACVALYGDSFTWSDEVDEEAAWGNQLARRLGCRVANYGYAGYGTDQAYLRFAERPDPEPGTVVLTHMTGDIVRNVSQWRAFARAPADANQWHTFKPRLRLASDGSLETLPPPAPPDIAAAIRAPRSAAPWDEFVPGARSGPALARFPYLGTLARAFAAKRMRDGAGHANWLIPYYSAGHASGAYALTLATLRAFDAEARRRGQAPLVAFLPHRSELIHFSRTGVWFSEPMMQSLRAAGVEVLALGPELVARSEHSAACDLFVGGDCKGHLNAKGCALQAEIVEKALRKRSLLDLGSLRGPVDARGRSL